LISTSHKILLVIFNYSKGQSGLELATRHPQPTWGSSCHGERLDPGQVGSLSPFWKPGLLETRFCV
jgi:hypothetical protein